MTHRIGSIAAIAALLGGPFAAAAQPADKMAPPAPAIAVPQPVQPVPAPGRPQIQPVRPLPLPGQPQIQPVRPLPLPGRPQIQPPRPAPQPQPVRPLPQPVRPQPQPVRPLPGNGWNNGGHWDGGGQSWNRQITCESRNGRRNQCNVNTGGYATLLRQHGGSPCRQGYSWGFTHSHVWVDRGCRGTFGVRYPGNWNGGGGGGSNTGAVIAGTAVAAGLIALLAASGNNGSNGNAPAAAAPPPYVPPPGSTGAPAAIVADLGQFPAAARPSVQTCLFEAAKQVGATGATKLAFDQIITLDQGNGGWRLKGHYTATYPGGSQPMTIFCRATPTQLIELEFTA